MYNAETIKRDKELMIIWILKISFLKQHQHNKANHIHTKYLSTLNTNLCYISN